MQTQEVAAGRELDALIAERVFGWRRVQAPKWDYHGALPEQGEVLAPPDMIDPINRGEYVRPPSGVIPFGFFVSTHYSTDIAAAWQIVEHMGAQSWRFACDDRQGKHGPWWAEFATKAYEHGGQANAPTLPLAICRAALLAIEAS